MSSCSESLAVIFLFIVLYISIQKTGYSFFFVLYFVIIKGVKVFLTSPKIGWFESFKLEIRF